MRQSRAFIFLIREANDLLQPARQVLIVVGICVTCVALGFATGEFGPSPWPLAETAGLAGRRSGPAADRCGHDPV